MLLQKLVLLGVLVMAGAGVARLTERSLVAQLVARHAAYVWNPFVAERLVIGHWPVLVGYAVLPWVIDAARTWRSAGRLPLPTVVAGAVRQPERECGAGDSGRPRWRSALAAAPARAHARGACSWPATPPGSCRGCCTPGTRSRAPSGPAPSRCTGEGSLPAPLAALALGGIWNSEVVPARAPGCSAGSSLVFARRDRRGRSCGRWSTRTQPPRRLRLPSVLGRRLGPRRTDLGGARTPMGWLVAHVPGCGLLRDGSRLLSLWCRRGGARGGVRRLRPSCGRLPGAARAGARSPSCWLPLALMPDAAFGLAGRLQPVAYPDDLPRPATWWTRAHDGGAPGDVLLLPMSSYRAARLEPRPQGARSGGPLPAARLRGQRRPLRRRRADRRRGHAGRCACRGPEAPTAEQRAAGLSALGVGFVVTERDAGRSPRSPGAPCCDGPSVLVQRSQERPRPARRRRWIVAMAVAWTLLRRQRRSWPLVRGACPAGASRRDRKTVTRCYSYPRV